MSNLNKYVEQYTENSVLSAGFKAPRQNLGALLFSPLSCFYLIGKFPPHYLFILNLIPISEFRSKILSLEKVPIKFGFFLAYSYLCN